MTDVDPTVRKRLLKIAELARRGVGGEKANAERMLARALARLGLTLEEIEAPDQVRHFHEFSFKSQFERRLLMRIVGMVRRESGGTAYYKIKRARSRVGFDLTSAEAAEVMVLFDTYSAALARDMDLFFSSFLHKHRIFGPPSDDDPDAPVPALTKEEHERVRRMLSMIHGMEDVTVQRRLEQSGPASSTEEFSP